MSLEVVGLDKCGLTKEEVSRAFAAVVELAIELGWDVPDYVLLIFAGDEAEYRAFRGEEFLELEDGLLVRDGVALVVLGSLLPNVLLDRLFLGFLAVFYYETFRKLSPEVLKELVREKYMRLLSSTYGK